MRGRRAGGRCSPFRSGARIQQALHAAEGPARDLDVLAHVLARLERERFTRHAARRAARQPRYRRRRRASRAIRQLHRLVELHDWQHNQFFAPIGRRAPLGHAPGVGDRGWRRGHGAHVGDLAAHRRRVRGAELAGRLPLRAPGRSISRDRRRAASARGFDGDDLGHPLIPGSAHGAQRRAPDAGDTRLLVVSGSNMSGKSTLLRTVGINAVLALAGAPVRATRAASDAAGHRRDAAHPGFAAGGAVALLRGDHAHPRARRPRRADRCRCCSCSTRLFTAPTRTIGSSAPPACCAACSTAAPSGSSRRTTWR